MSDNAWLAVAHALASQRGSEIDEAALSTAINAAADRDRYSAAFRAVTFPYAGESPTPRAADAWIHKFCA
jgi:hypothetical protein